MVLMLLLITSWFLCRFCQASPDDPWSSCPADKVCKNKFANGLCNNECSGSQCLRDGFDCLENKHTCKSEYIQYCRDHYDNTHCEHGCNTAPCGWDGSDCFKDQHSKWAKGTLILQTAIPFHRSPFQNGSLLWALSILIRTSVVLRRALPFQPSADLNSLSEQQLIDLHQQAPNYRSNGSLLFLQVDNRPCSQQPFSCFPYALEVADYINAILHLKLIPVHVKTELQVLVRIRGINRELPVTETSEIKSDGYPSWFWPVVSVSVGVGISLALMALVLLVWNRRRRRRSRRDEKDRVHQRSTATESNDESKAWVQHTSRHKEQKGRVTREKDRNGMKKKKKKAKELGKKRREPLGEDAIRMQPLRKTLDIGSDTDMTQSSMEDISKTICDHRSPVQKHYGVTHQQLSVPRPPRRWDRNPNPPHQRTPSNSTPVQWCGPDGSVVLIRAVRSGLDRVVLELLRAGVPVNNTDHTGKSALHWACSVNHLSLARTLIRYGAAVDMQDHKGETPLFLSALHGCYETARLLLLNGANQEVPDRRGRQAIDMAQEGVHHQVLELLLAHRVQRSPIPVVPTTEVLWDDRTYMYSPWMASTPCLPGRSASFSGIVGHREMSPPQPSDWQLPSPQNWRPISNQSTMGLVSPRIHGRPSQPIGTLQEVTSEAEEEEREMAQEALRPTTPYFSSPQPAPRQRSFSCTQPAVQRRYNTNHPELPARVPPEKPANENVDIVVMPCPKTSSGISDSRGADTGCAADTEQESKKSGATVSSQRSAMSIQTVM